MRTYRTFIRSVRNFEEFSSARKITKATGLTIEDALRMCREFNDNRTPGQKAKGTKMEFTEE